jgi:hypothetical protein
MANLAGIVEQLKEERDRVEKHLSALNAALSAFVGVYSGSVKRRISAAGRRRISLAQKARWAKRAASNGNAVRPKRTMSASARRKIAAAQRARWKKVKAKAA